MIRGHVEITEFTQRYIVICLDFIISIIIILTKKVLLLFHYSLLDPPTVIPSFSATDNMTESSTPHKLQCTVESNPKPEITWYFNGKIHNKNISEVVIELTDYKSVVQSTLSFPRGVTKEDHGMYTCNATNKLGIDSKTVEINVWCKYFHVVLTLCDPKNLHELDLR